MWFSVQEQGGQRQFLEKIGQRDERHLMSGVICRKEESSSRAVPSRTILQTLWNKIKEKTTLIKSVKFW